MFDVERFERLASAVEDGDAAATQEARDILIGMSRVTSDALADFFRLIASVCWVLRRSSDEFSEDCDAQKEAC